MPTIEPDLPVSEYLDIFGNRVGRILRGRRVTPFRLA